MYYNRIKRVADLVFSLIIFVLISPIFILITLLLIISNRGEAFFTQYRPGKNEKLFRLIKFKTMNDRKDGSGKLLPDKERLTDVGRFIRSTSLDELPQLINVIRGEMSIIGPRPLLIKYLPRYSKEQSRRHEVRPGITGWAQINGRNAISWEEKLTLDVYYVDNYCLSLDIRIFFLTLLKVIKRSDISSSTSVTMEEFLGNEKLKSK